MSFSELHANYLRAEQGYSTWAAAEENLAYTPNHLEECRRLVILATDLLKGNPQTDPDLTTCQTIITNRRIALIAVDQDLVRRGIRHDVNVEGACSVASRALQAIAHHKGKIA